MARKGKRKPRYRLRKHKGPVTEPFWEERVDLLDTDGVSAESAESHADKEDSDLLGDDDDYSEPATKYCPDCGGPLVESSVQSIATQGVGQTYHQTHMRSWSVATEFVCRRCGFVAGTSERRTHR